MSSIKDQILSLVIDKIRSTIDEDWVHDFDITRETRFDSELEIESIEFVRIAAALQAHYGPQLDIVGWLSGRSIQELIGLSVGELSDFIAGTVAEA